MKLYTSYWAQVRHFPRNLISLSTVMWQPKYEVKDSTGNPALIVVCNPVRPGVMCEGLCHGQPCNDTPDKCEFLKTYRVQLEQLDIGDFMRLMQKLHDTICVGEGFDDVDFAFIFYEKYDNPCSERWPLQDWLRAHDIEVEEWNKNDG